MIHCYEEPIGWAHEDDGRWYHEVCPSSYAGSPAEEQRNRAGLLLGLICLDCEEFVSVKRNRMALA